MEKQAIAAFFDKCAPGWDADLKKLKYCRHIRNKIAHDPGCTEENMCAPGDAAWLESFHRRIMRCEDPLALYRKAKKQIPTLTRRAWHFARNAIGSSPEYV